MSTSSPTFMESNIEGLQEILKTKSVGDEGVIFYRGYAVHWTLYADELKLRWREGKCPKK